MPKILVIDDEPLFREAMTAALQRKGFEAFDAANGRVGAELARCALPDLILCDVNMDDMDGYATLAALRRDPATATIPFIFMTGMADASAVRRGMDSGADDFLAKPLNAQQVLGAIHARLQKHETLRATAEKKLSDLRVNLSLALPHEMITPLNGIFGVAQVLATDAESLTPAEVAEFGNIILTSAERLHRTVQNFLLFGRLEIQAAHPADIADLRRQETAGVREWITARARHAAERAGRHGDLHLDAGDATVAIGSDLFTKLVDELAGNAFKFSPAGTEVNVKAWAEEGRFHVSVTDRGPGITPEQIASIGAYAQFNRKTQEQQGSGLGLAIARRIADLHGGSLSLRSDPGPGTTATFVLPLSGQ